MSIVWTLVLFLLAGALCVAAVIHALATMLLRPPRMTDGKALYVLKRMSPADLGMMSEAIAFDLPKTDRSPAIRIAAWWINAPSASEKTVVIIHGYGDAKVGGLAWAPTWRALGFNCLLIDLRAHGESGGTITTGGALERDDLDVILNQIRRDRARQTSSVVLFGISLGGAVALACAARREDIDAVVTDSMFAAYDRAAHAHGRLIGAPLPKLLPLVTRWAEKRAKVSFAEARPLDTIGEVKCPVLLIHGEADPFVPADQVAALRAALESRGNSRDCHWIVPDAAHVLSLAANADAYRGRLGSFVSAIGR